MKMRIKLDVDGVIKNIIDTSIQIYKEFYDSKDNTKYDDIKIYDMSVAMPGITDFYKFFTQHGKYIFGEAKPYPGAVDFMNSLKNKGHDIAICTNQFKGNEKYTLQWLEQYHIPYDSVHFVKDKTIVKGDLLIDDCIDNLVACQNNHMVACYDQPWNQDWKGTRFMNYSQALEWINSIDLK